MLKFFRPLIDRFPLLAQTYRNLRDEFDKRQPPLKTPWGWKLAGSPLMASGQFEVADTRCVRHMLAEVDIFVNIGANVGYYCCHALSLGKAVIAVEPIACNLHYLLKNLSQNKAWQGHAEIWPVAVGAKAGILNMWGGGTGASLIKGWAQAPESYVRRVPVVTLDRLLAHRLCGLRALILVDVEGAEYDLLRGATDVLTMQPKPVWIIEVAGKMHQPEGQTGTTRFAATFEMMQQAGYVATLPDDGDFRQMASSSLSKSIEEQQGRNYVFRQMPSTAQLLPDNGLPLRP